MVTKTGGFSGPELPRAPQCEAGKGLAGPGLPLTPIPLNTTGTIKPTVPLAHDDSKGFPA